MSAAAARATATRAAPVHVPAPRSEIAFGRAGDCAEAEAERIASTVTTDATPVSPRVLRYSGRDIVVVETAQGPWAFYRRTGLSPKETAVKVGEWAPFDGIVPGRMLKDQYYKNATDGSLLGYGTQALRDAAKWLDSQKIAAGKDVGEVFSIVNEFLREHGALRMPGL